MAITKILKVKDNPKNVIDYITNKKKTQEKLLVSSLGCMPESAASSFHLALTNGDIQRRNNEITAYHIIQSFSPDDKITPEEAHKIGMEFMKKLFGAKFAFVCATHVDKNHIHNHFAICSAPRAMTGGKLYDDLSLLHKMQKISDEICRENGLHVIDKKRRKSKTYKEWLEDKTAPTGSKKTQLRKLIDKTVFESDSFEDFIEKIQAAGVEISTGTSKKYGAVTKYKFPDEEHFHRGYSLGTFYTDDNIRLRIARRLKYKEEQERKKEEYRARKRAAYGAMTPAEKIMDKSKVKIKQIRDTSDVGYGKDQAALRRWLNVQNAKRMQQIMREIQSDYGINYTRLSGTLSALAADNNRLAQDIEEHRHNLEEMRSFIENCAIYRRFCFHEELMKKAENPEAYYEEHAAEIDLMRTATCALRERNVVLESINVEAMKKFQNQITEYETELQQLEAQQEQNAREQEQLRAYQKEMNTYYGKEQDDI